VQEDEGENGDHPLLSHVHDLQRGQYPALSET